MLPSDPPLSKAWTCRKCQNEMTFETTRWRCKPCDKAYWKAHRAANKERLSEERKRARWRNPEAYRETRRAWHRERRLKAVELLGSVCCRCGFADERALQVDHVNGNGAVERDELGHQEILNRVLAGESGYQLLCANCNWIKRAENNETRRLA